MSRMMIQTRSVTIAEPAPHFHQEIEVGCLPGAMPSDVNRRTMSAGCRLRKYA